jgi:UDP-N-acetylmuramyl tripeptide synthase
VTAVPGRFEEVAEGQPFTVLVDYAHTPDALANVLNTARGLGGRVLCVFGAGGDRDREKRPQMGRVASQLADVAIVTSDNPRSEEPEAIIDEVVAGAGRERRRRARPAASDRARTRRSATRRRRRDRRQRDTSRGRRSRTARCPSMIALSRARLCGA